MCAVDLPRRIFDVLRGRGRQEEGRFTDHNTALNGSAKTINNRLYKVPLLSTHMYACMNTPYKGLLYCTNTHFAVFDVSLQ